MERPGLSSVLSPCPALATLVPRLLVYSPAARSSAEEVRQLTNMCTQELG